MDSAVGIVKLEGVRPRQHVKRAELDLYETEPSPGLTGAVYRAARTSMSR